MLSALTTTVLGLLAVTAPVLSASPFAVNYLEPRSHSHHHWHSKGSLGSKCRFNSQCTGAPTGSRPSCNKEGVCDFVCLSATYPPILVKNAAGTGCIPNPTLKSQCSKDAQCKGKVRGLPKDAQELCLYNQCTYDCKEGYHKISGKCYKNMDSCHWKKCAPITGGVTFCSKTNECVYRCDEAAGYTLYTNAKKDAYKCVNTGSDQHNCGSTGNVCSGGYNGIGKPVCLSGTCSVDCTGHGTRKVNKKGQYYCSRH